MVYNADCQRDQDVTDLPNIRYLPKSQAGIISRPTYGSHMKHNLKKQIK